MIGIGKNSFHLHEPQFTALVTDEDSDVAIATHQTPDALGNGSCLLVGDRESLRPASQVVCGHEQVFHPIFGLRHGSNQVDTKLDQGCIRRGDGVKFCRGLAHVIVALALVAATCGIQIITILVVSVMNVK